MDNPRKRITTYNVAGGAMIIARRCGEWKYSRLVPRDPKFDILDNIILVAESLTVPGEGYVIVGTYLHGDRIEILSRVVHWVVVKMAKKYASERNFKFVDASDLNVKIYRDKYVVEPVTVSLCIIGVIHKNYLGRGRG